MQSFNKCRFCGDEFQGMDCPICGMMKSYSARFSECMMCHIGVKESPLFIRIVDELEAKFHESAKDLSYQGVLERESLKRQRELRAETLTPDDVMRLNTSFRSDQIMPGTEVLCKKCIERKKIILKEKRVPALELERWKREWLLLVWGEEKPVKQDPFDAKMKELQAKHSPDSNEISKNLAKIGELAKNLSEIEELNRKLKYTKD
jgi:hypothetical protein